MEIKKISRFFRSNKVIFVILMLGLVLYSIYLFHDTLSPDEAEILWASKEISNNPSNLFSVSTFEGKEPLVPILISFLDIFLPNEIAGRILLLLFSLLGAFFFYLLAKEITNKRIALLSSLFLILNPWYWMMTNRVLQDVPVTVMIIITLYFLIRFIKNNKLIDIILTIIFLVLSILTKQVAVMVIPIILVFMLYIVFSRNKHKYFTKNSRTSVYLILIVSSIVVLVLSYLLLTKEFILNYLSYFREMSYLVYLRNLDYLVSNSFELLFGFVPVGIHFFIYILSLIFFCICIYVIIKSDNKFTYLFIFSWFFSVFIFRLIFGGDIVRYILPLLPPLLLLIVLTLSDLSLYLNLRFNFRSLYVKYMKRIVYLIVVMLAVIYVILGLKIGLLASYNDPGFKEAGNWLKENVEDDDIIYAGSSRQIRYYTEIDYIVNSGLIYSYGDGNMKSIPITVKYIPKEHSNKTVYMQMDFREKYQTNWIYKANLIKAEIIKETGFKLVHVVYKDMPFYIMPPNNDRNEFLEYLDISPYEISFEGSNIYVSGADTYTYNFDNGEYIENIGFEKADSVFDYFSFIFTKPTYLRQPVVLIFKRDPINLTES